jgi:hypothetical protein
MLFCSISLLLSPSTLLFMWISLSGIGIFLLVLIVAALFTLMLLITSIWFTIEKQRLGEGAKNSRASIFFFANIRTGILNLILILIGYQIKGVVHFFDHLSWTFLLSFLLYWVPFCCFLLPFRKAH